MKKLTIFTPAYNRGYTLDKLYKSLINQTDNNFEWLIVDDGSSDNTKEIVESWIEDNIINIRYIYQDNQGKQIAHNTGVLNAKYELFVCVDSDDYCTYDFVEKILNKSKEIYNNNKLVGIIAYRKFINKDVKYIIPKVKYLTLTDLNFKYHYKNDLVLVYKTEILKKYLFPKIEGEKFIPETYVYNQIDEIGKMALLPEKIYICEYLKDGYTNNTKKLIKNNPKGYALCAKQRMEITPYFINKVRSASQYTVGSWLAGDKEFIKNENKYIYKILILACIPISLVFYIKKYK